MDGFRITEFWRQFVPQFGKQGWVGPEVQALIAHLPGVYWLKELGLTNLRVVGPTLNTSKYCFAFPKDKPGLASDFSESLAILKQTGEYQKIHDKWLGILEPQSTSFATVLKYVAMIIPYATLCVQCASRQEGDHGRKPR